MYTNRYMEPEIVKSIEGSAVTSETGWTAGAPAELLKKLKPGDEYAIEHVGSVFGRITGWLFDGVWYDRKTDEQIVSEHEAMLAGFARVRREMLDANREDWTARELNLPDWLKQRLQAFHERGGETFELEGWGYELVVCELAALYDHQGLPAERDSQAVMDYAKAQGTSGNQHEMAKALVHAHDEGESLYNTVSALSPITGDAFYEGR